MITSSEGGPVKLSTQLDWWVPKTDEFCSKLGAKEKVRRIERIEKILTQAFDNLSGSGRSPPVDLSEICAVAERAQNMNLLSELGKNILLNIKKNIDLKIVDNKDDSLEGDRKLAEEVNKTEFFDSKIQATLGSKVKYLLEKFKDLFVGKIRYKINQQIFYVWNQKIRFQSSLKNIVLFGEKIKILEDKLSKNPENKSLVSQLEETKVILQRTEKFIVEYEKGLASGEATRKQLLGIGGTRVALQTSDKVVLDGTYLSADNFQKKIIDANGMSLHLNVSIEGGSEAEVSGLIIPKGSKGDQLLKNLEQLKLFADFSADSKNKGAGWAKVDMGREIAILPDFVVKELLDNKKIEERGGVYSFVEGEKIKISRSPLEMSSENSGTVILGVGAAGVYEMYKRESLSLLMQGVNVMLFNHRGQGESTGMPTEKGTYDDMETVYEYLKQVHGTEDNKLVLRGLCLSGGIVSELAGKHPDVNIILDQTYADISDLSLKTVLDSVKDVLRYNPDEEEQVKNIVLRFLTPILRTVTSLVSPDFGTARHLNKVKGKILVLRTTEDTYTDKTMTDKLLDSYAKNASPEAIAFQMQVGHMSGIHGTTWLDAKNDRGEGKEAQLGRYHVLSFLKNVGALNPFIDNGIALQRLSKEYVDYVQSSAEAAKKLEEGIKQLPESPEDLPQGFADIPLEVIDRAQKTKTEIAKPLEGINQGRNYFEGVLSELDRLKDRLGGSPIFGSSKPTIDEADNNKKFLGLSISAVKDWFSMVLQDQWIPKLFWKSVAKIFDVSADNQNSQYEEAHLRIQRFGMLIANKERFFEILEKKDKKRFGEFGTITGLAWHPKSNGPGTEKTYIEFIERFLTEYFEEAKKKGDDALVEYFGAFVGVCFEDRARNLEEYAIKHPIGGSAEVTALVKSVLDIDTSRSFDEGGGAFDVIFTDLGLKSKQELTPGMFLEELKKNDIFNKEFTKDGIKVKPTLEDVHKYALKMIEAYVMDPYPINEFLEIELEIFKISGKGITEANFREQLQSRDGTNGGEFSASSSEVQEFIRNYIHP